MSRSSKYQSSASHGFDGVSSFVVRRALALSYCSAFLSFLAQVDGLYGCDGLHPSKAYGIIPASVVPFAIYSVAFLGALLASAALLAVRACERFSVATFGTLWFLFALCLDLAPNAFLQLEDKMLVETGLVGVFLATRGRSNAATVSRKVGRTLSAWLLFRAVFSNGALKLLGTCGAWRNLSAIKEIYQLEPFPLPSAWIVHVAPLQVSQALTVMQLYIELALSPLMLLPWTVVAWPAALSQLLSIGLSMILANKGFMSLCYLSLVLSFFDNSWHKAIWSKNMLTMWGCSEDGFSEGTEEDKEEEEDEEEEEEEEEEDEKQQSKKNGESDQEDSSIAIVVLCFVCGYVASVIGAFALAQSDLHAGPSQTLFVSLCLIALIALVMSPLGLAPWRGDIALGCLPLRIIGTLVWTFGALQFAGDILAPSKLPVPLSSLSVVLERTHVAHMLGAGARELQPCLHEEGRIDFVVQGAVLGGDTRKSPFVSLSSRFLPVVEERRAAWLQPYTPRLDKELWRLAQKPLTNKKQMDLPKWTTRLMASLALRQGAGAQLASGPWRGLNAMLYGPGNSEYAKLTPPLPAMTITRMSHKPVEDVRSFKWWKKQDSRVMHLLAEEELSKALRKLMSKCQPSPLVEVPVAEALTALLIVAFLGKMLVPAKKKKQKAKRS